MTCIGGPGPYRDIPAVAKLAPSLHASSLVSTGAPHIMMQRKHWTAAVAAVALVAVTAPAQRQQKSQEELQALRAEKLAKDVFKKADWITDYDKARETAKKDGKLIFAYFTRSYAG